MFDAEHAILDVSSETDIILAAKSFVDGADAIAAQLTSYFKSVEDGCTQLLQIGVDFSNTNNISCPYRIIFGNGCDAQLRALQCELSAFLNEIKIKRDEAGRYLKRMISCVGDLVTMAKRFASTNDLTRSNYSEAEYCALKKIIVEFIIAFNQLHWIGHIEFIKLQHLCDQVTGRVSLLYTKYYCWL